MSLSLAEYKVESTVKSVTEILLEIVSGNKIR